MASDHEFYYRCPKCDTVERSAMVMWEPDEDEEMTPFCRRCYFEWLKTHVPVMEFDHSE